MVTWDEAEAIFRSRDPKFEAWSPAQREAYDKWASLKRQLLFFPTGEGKTKTALAMMTARGHKRLVIIAPLATHAAWREDAKALGMDARIETVQKFRLTATKYAKTDEAWIIDEYHQLGGPDKMGFKKFNRMMRHYTGDLVMCSATPNYNDAERVFCLTAIGDEAPNRNYIQWLWDNCNCKVNRFSQVPDVINFKEYDSAIDFLLSRPWVSYVEDKAMWESKTLKLPLFTDDLFERFNVNKRSKSLMGSEMEKRHARINYRFINDRGYIRQEVLQVVTEALGMNPERKKWIVFCAHKTIAQALHQSIFGNIWLIDGDTPKTRRDFIKNEFIRAKSGWLIGTDAIATGMDGVDKTCTSMLILDDINGDYSLRRQLIGRILPRGAADDRPRLVITATF